MLGPVGVVVGLFESMGLAGAVPNGAGAVARCAVAGEVARCAVAGEVVLAWGDVAGRGVDAGVQLCNVTSSVHKVSLRRLSIVLMTFKLGQRCAPAGHTLGQATLAHSEDKWR